MPDQAAQEGGRAYLAIDLKSFYASVECVDRGLDPMTTNLVVADTSRTEKTICLAVSPSLKAHGIGGRARLFEVVERMKAVNEERRLRAPGRRLAGESCDARDLAADPRLKATYIAAMPRMARYLEASAEVYATYLRYAAPEDIHVYSIDEVFVDATRYLNALGMTPRQMASAMVRDVYRATGIVATAGIGTNLYLAKVAMDILAKHEPADEHGVRVAELDERSYRERLWAHRPLTDFWRVGRGTARRLEYEGLMTMGDVARCSLGRDSEHYNEDLLYRMLGVNAELLIDHAWGWEPCTIADIKDYRPEGHSISSGQVLTGPATAATARLIVKEMADSLALDLVDQGLKASRLALAIGYDVGSLDPARLDSCASPEMRRLAARSAVDYDGPESRDWYGRRVPKPASGAIALERHTSSSQAIRDAMARLCDRIVDPRLLVRRITVVADGLAYARQAQDGASYEQPDLFSGLAEDVDGTLSAPPVGHGSEAQEASVQRALLDVKRRFGRNAVIKAMDMEPGATGQDRNRQIGGHRA
ncbi:type VI secretion protein ImpB [Bifidobacterium pullorum subsp. saeculare]|uniref:Type VI secretion protein ImpB n=1 Tax=Bifidobacterium pullorum subsp. saeculare TaxID=78257 RepID=A0A938WWE0_9BIFI|nr:type VI secretion protein ImpB [Bifidobacterium pullorum]MBM6698803.1 type VI secretion protein ImpB [Bifidobacterium pullorum subsp. saeculare]